MVSPVSPVVSLCPQVELVGARLLDDSFLQGAPEAELIWIVLFVLIGTDLSDGDVVIAVVEHNTVETNEFSHSEVAGDVAVSGEGTSVEHEFTSNLEIGALMGAVVSVTVAILVDWDLVYDFSSTGGAEKRALADATLLIFKDLYCLLLTPPFSLLTSGCFFFLFPRCAFSVFFAALTESKFVVFLEHTLRGLTREVEKSGNCEIFLFLLLALQLIDRSWLFLPAFSSPVMILGIMEGLLE